MPILPVSRTANLKSDLPIILLPQIHNIILQATYLQIMWMELQMLIASSILPCRPYIC